MVARQPPPSPHARRNVAPAGSLADGVHIDEGAGGVGVFAQIDPALDGPYRALAVLVLVVEEHLLDAPEVWGLLVEDREVAEAGAAVGDDRPSLIEPRRDGSLESLGIPGVLGGSNGRGGLRPVRGSERGEDRVQLGPDASAERLLVG